MRGHGGPRHADLGALVSAASDHEGPWPTISIWHGSSDATVSPSNADAIVAQWQTLHGVARQPSRIDVVDGYPRRVWINDEGREVIEEYSITGMGHGTPLETGGEEECGTAMAYMLDVDISSTRHIAAFWGLTDRVTHRLPAAISNTREPFGNLTEGRIGKSSRPGTASRTSAGAASVGGVGKVIEDALRAAGLMR
jgi:poly(3-hydroxybutyrate) depolymerase